MKPVYKQPGFLLSCLIPSPGIYLLIAHPHPVSVGLTVLLFGIPALEFIDRERKAISTLLSEVRELIQNGQFEQAAQRLDEAARVTQLASFRRVLSIYRAMLDYQWGRVEAALARAGFALDGPRAILNRDQLAVVALELRGARAILRAARGEVDKARADIAIVRGSKDPDLATRARAALAEAMLLGQAGDVAALREHLDRERGLLLALSPLNERALARAYLRMVDTDSATPYRQKGTNVITEQEDSSLVDWVAQLAPNAAPFVSASARVAPHEYGHDGPEGHVGLDEAPSAEATRAVAKAHDKPVNRWRMWGLLALLAASIVAVFIVLPHKPVVEPSSPQAPEITGAESTLVPTNHQAEIGQCTKPRSPRRFRYDVLTAFALFIGAGLWGLRWLSRRTPRAWRELDATQELVWRGELDRAEAPLRELGRSRNRSLATYAESLLADIAYQRGDFAEALEHCDRGLEHIAEKRGLINAAHVTAQRAAVLTALGREDEALAELARLTKAEPQAYFLRVRFLRLVRRGAFAEAARLMAQRPINLRLVYCEEMLAELTALAAAPASMDTDEAEHLLRELRRDPTMDRWARAIAPELLATVERGAQRAEETTHAAPA